LCGEEKSGKKHEEEVMGQDVVICDDCYDELEDLGDDFEEGFEDLKDLFK
jgi:ribosome-binding protein aMBF1 (putative translation factor)